MLTPGPGHRAHPCAVPAAHHGSAPSEPPAGKLLPAEISETHMRLDTRDLQACSWGLARALASLHKDTGPCSSCPQGPQVLHAVRVGDSQPGHEGSVLFAAAEHDVQLKG